MKELTKMAEKKPTYLESLLEASIIRDKEEGYTFIFQKEKIKLNDGIEVDMLKEMHSDFTREIIVSEDELHVKIQPSEAFVPFSFFKKKTEEQKWQFAYQLVKSIQNHSFTRFHLVVCPENLMFDASLTPAFLHYGIKESIPPYEYDPARELVEVKATIASLVDSKYSFIQYLKLHETIQLSEVASKLINADDLNELLTIIRQQLTTVEEVRKTVVSVPKKKWTIFRFTSIGVTVLLVPALIYTFYSTFFLQPKQEAFVSSNEAFLQQEYSGVIEQLEDYKVKEMPKVVQYELALAYLTNESLSEEQKEVIQNTVTLQSDDKYLSYWIHIGRGENEQALEEARLLEDRSLILYGLYKYEHQLKADESLASDERKEKLDPVQSEIEELESQIEEEEKQTEESAENEQQENQKQSEPADNKQEEDNKQSEKEVEQNKDDKADEKPAPNSDSSDKPAS